jgi:hypothetical protein
MTNSELSNNNASGNALDNAKQCLKEAGKNLWQTIKGAGKMAYYFPGAASEFIWYAACGTVLPGKVPPPPKLIEGCMDKEWEATKKTVIGAVNTVANSLALPGTFIGAAIDGAASKLGWKPLAPNTSDVEALTDPSSKLGKIVDFGKNLGKFALSSIGTIASVGFSEFSRQKAVESTTQISHYMNEAGKFCAEGQKKLFTNHPKTNGIVNAITALPRIGYNITQGIIAAAGTLSSDPMVKEKSKEALNSAIEGTIKACVQVMSMPALAAGVITRYTVGLMFDSVKRSSERAINECSKCLSDDNYFPSKAKSEQIVKANSQNTPNGQEPTQAVSGKLEQVQDSLHLHKAEQAHQRNQQSTIMREALSNKAPPTSAEQVGLLTTPNVPQANQGQNQRPNAHR